ncbi:MAG: RluA family pseudouridine synthase [Spirochaetales bacterium]|nr:RluA family pseudouridine synthase [Spirochaetales bacterium]
MKILLEDNHLLIVCKPSGLTVQGDGHKIDLIEICKKYIKEKYHKPGNVFCSAAHRLDTPASGIVILSRTSRAARRLQEQFRSRQVRKIYQVLCENPLPPGLYKDHLLQDERSRKARVADGGKEAQLEVVSCHRVKLLPQKIPLYLLEIQLITGRYHQIRCQLSSRGLPVVGDFKYGSRLLLSDPEEPSGASAIYLHAFRLELLHPVQKEMLRLECAPDWNYEELPG